MPLKYFSTVFKQKSAGQVHRNFFVLLISIFFLTIYIYIYIMWRIRF